MQVRINQSEKDALTAAARLAGLSLSAWARERLRWAAKKELESEGMDVPFLTIE